MAQRNLNGEVAAEIARRFSPSDAATAETLLKSTPLPLLPDLVSVDAARVHMAAIKVANGDLERLRAALAAATSDWRDLLLAADLAGNDWQEVLTQSGFRIPRAT